MSLIWLIDYDGKMPNLALMKLSAWHEWEGRIQGDATLLLRGPGQPPTLFETADKAYVSCTFSWNREAVLDYVKRLPCDYLLGGAGVDPQSTLPDVVEKIRSPNYALYDFPDALGFISRGCVRCCPWCIVPEKEGPLRRVSTAKEIVQDRRSAVFLDNNFLALPDCVDDLKWLCEHEVEIDFNQGLDARFVNDENLDWLRQCKWKRPLTLACDSDNMIEPVEQAIRLCDTPMPIMVYVLIGYWGLESDLRRLHACREMGVDVFPMGYRENATGEEPMNGWIPEQYKKFRRLITRVPHSKKVWQMLRDEVQS